MKQHFPVWLKILSALLAAVLLIGGLGSTSTAWGELLTWLGTKGVPTDNLVVTILLFALIVGVFTLISLVAERLVKNNDADNKAVDQNLARQTYLSWFVKDINNRLKSSIHRARFIDLEAETVADAVDPWHYEYEEIQQHSDVQRCDTFEQIIEQNQRILLLGGPGAGKTTTLLHVASSLGRQAQDLGEDKIPLLLNLSLWERPENGDPAKAQNHEDFKQWLIASMVAIRGAGVCQTSAKAWIDNAQLWLLLDGLDEVKESLRGEVVNELNQFFEQHSGIPVIVCSRSADYQMLVKSKTANKLELDLAVSVQPLTPKMVDDYLLAAQATRLREALKDDPELRQMATTPLELSLMVLAYGDDAAMPDKPSGSLSMTARRMHLFEAFVDAMMQRKSRRDSGARDEVNLQSRKRLETLYSITEVNRYLGWLAQRMSERSRTSINMSKLYQNLWNKDGEGARPLMITTSAMVALFSFVVMLVFQWSDLDQTAWIISAGVGMLAAIYCPWWLYFKQKVDDSKLKFSALMQLWLPFWLLFLPAFGLLIGSGNEFLPWPLSGFLVLLLFIIAGFFIVMDAFEKKALVALITGVYIFVLIILILVTAIDSPLAGWSLFLAAGSLLFCLFLMEKKLIGISLLWAIYYLTAGLIGVWLFATQSALASGLMAGAIVTGISMLWFDKSYYYKTLTAMVLFTLGAIVGVLVDPRFGLVVGLLSLLLLQVTGDGVGRFMASMLVNPLLLHYLIINNKLPPRMIAFCRYCLDSLLLKGEYPMVAFTHRRVQDYFAIREVVLAFDDEQMQRHHIAEQLCQLGDASCDVLLELVNDNDPDIRATCINGLGLIGSAIAAQTLINIIETAGEGLKQQAYQALAKITDVAATPLLVDVLQQAKLDKDQAKCRATLIALDTMGQLDEVDDLVELLEFVEYKKSLSPQMLKVLINQGQLTHPRVIQSFRSIYAWNIDKYKVVFSACAKLHPADVIPQVLTRHIEYKVILLLCRKMSREAVIAQLALLVDRFSYEQALIYRLLWDLSAMPKLTQPMRAKLIKFQQEHEGKLATEKEQKSSSIIKRILCYAQLTWVIRQGDIERQLDIINGINKAQVRFMESKLVKLLLANDDRVRIAAVNKLSEFRCDSKLALVLAVDDNQAVREAGIKNLTCHSSNWSNWIKVLDGLEPIFRAQLKQYLCSCKTNIQHQLALYVFNHHVEFKVEMASELMATNPNEAEQLMLLNDPEVAVRIAAVKGLKKNNETVAQALLAMLDSKEKNEVEAVILAVRALKYKAATPKLLPLMLQLNLATVVAVTLFDLDEKEQLASILVEQMAKSAGYYPIAKKYLPECATTTTINRLLEFTHEPVVDLRVCAVIILGDIGQGLVAERLLAMLDDKELNSDKQRVCDIAATSLDNIGTPELKQKLEEWRASELPD